MRKYQRVPGGPFSRFGEYSLAATRGRDSLAASTRRETPLVRGVASSRFILRPICHFAPLPLLRPATTAAYYTWYSVPGMLPWYDVGMSGWSGEGRRASLLLMNVLIHQWMLWCINECFDASMDVLMHQWMFSCFDASRPPELKTPYMLVEITMTKQRGGYPRQFSFTKRRYCRLQRRVAEARRLHVWRNDYHTNRTVVAYSAEVSNAFVPQWARMS